MLRILFVVLLLPAACVMPTVHEADVAAVRGRTWAITGASSGTVRGVAERAGAMGAKVVLAGRRAAALQDVAQVIDAQGGEVLVVPTDVNQPDALEALADGAERHFGRGDVWFNAADVAPIGRLEDIPVADHARTVAVNRMAGCSGAMPRFCARGEGTLVNMASVDLRYGHRRPGTHGCPLGSLSENPA